MAARLLSIYRPAPAVPRLPADQIASSYRRYRWQIMATIFAGYASFYLVRKNFSLAKPDLMREYGLTTGDVGLVASALAIAYGLSKFLMGNLSDRSNPRYFLATGLFASAALNLCVGAHPSVWFLAGVWFLNGWAQGMGWPACGRTITHWFSDRERGTKFALWNIAHNVGGGLIGPIVTLALLLFTGWRCIFYVPAVISMAMGVVVLVFLRDTPQSVGLPPIEEHMNDYPPVAVEDRERELSAGEIFRRFILPNRVLWALAFANVFVYLLRYGVLDWAPVYLTKVKHVSPGNARWLFTAFEYAGIPGTLLVGWASDRFFRGRRAPASVLCMVIVAAAVLVYWFNPPGHMGVDLAALCALGFFIYGPVMLIGVAAVDSVPKKAAGTAAGLTGLFGYVGGDLTAELGIGKIVQHSGWDTSFIFLLAACGAAIGLLALTWNAHDRGVEAAAAAPGAEDGGARTAAG